jgi:Chlorophyll A-B binding protein
VYLWQQSTVTLERDGRYRLLLSRNTPSAHTNSTMMKIAALFALLGSAAAFAPVHQTKISTTALSGWKEETVIGITPPVGFFDPMGLSIGKSDEVMMYYRESELKHGRVAMAACLGWYITAGGVHPAFDSSLSSDPLEAAQQLPFVAWIQFILGCGAVEWITEKIKERPGYVPGDILGAAYWVDNSDEGWVDYQNKEITNGRLAMLAFAGILTQDILFGNYGDMIFKQ